VHMSGQHGGQGFGGARDEARLPAPARVPAHFHLFIRDARGPEINYFHIQTPTGIGDQSAGSRDFQFARIQSHILTVTHE
jgi:hypothetical protein